MSGVTRGTLQELKELRTGVREEKLKSIAHYVDAKVRNAYERGQAMQVSLHQGEIDGIQDRIDQIYKSRPKWGSPS